MRKTGLLLLLAVLCAVLPSCRRVAEKAGEKIRIEEVERVSGRGVTGAEIVVRVVNDSRYKIALERASLDLYMGQSCACSAELLQPVEVARRTTASVATQWRIRIVDPLALYAVVRRVQRNDITQIGVSFSVEGHGGPLPVNFSREKMPLSEFLNTFGVDLQELKNYFE